VNISDILKWKAANGTDAVHAVAPSDTVGDLLRALADHNIGALIVLDGDVVAGVVSERDVVRRLGTDGAALIDRPVRDIMTTDVFVCSSGDTIDAIAETMTARRVRHMPVVDGDRLVGIVSIGDVVSHRIRQLEKDRGQLEQYISG
jgi:CBS domain-containing protein